MTADSGWRPPTPRVPVDPFDRALYRQTLDAALDCWRGHGDTVILGDMVNDTEWAVTVAPTAAFDPMTIGSQPLLRGVAWIAEREYPRSEHYRVVPMCRFVAQPGLFQAREAPINEGLLLADWRIVASGSRPARRA